MLTDIMTLQDLDVYISGYDKNIGILFCFGTSMISRIIQMKTRKNNNEIVPSHVAMIYKNSIYESTSGEENVGHKKIHAGVRRWEIPDFIKSEYKKQTDYAVLTLDEIDVYKADKYIHLPYGKDTILDFLLKDGSDGDSNGLICSQYVNLVTELLPSRRCPTPADLYRKAKEIIGENKKKYS